MVAEKAKRGQRENELKTIFKKTNQVDQFFKRNFFKRNLKVNPREANFKCGGCQPAKKKWLENCDEKNKNSANN